MLPENEHQHFHNDNTPKNCVATEKSDDFSLIFADPRQVHFHNLYLELETLCDMQYSVRGHCRTDNRVSQGSARMRNCDLLEIDLYKHGLRAAYDIWVTEKK